MIRNSPGYFLSPRHDTLSKRQYILGSLIAPLGTIIGSEVLAFFESRKEKEKLLFEMIVSVMELFN